MNYIQLPNELNLKGYPGSDFTIPFRLEGITGAVSMRTYELVGATSTELGAAFRPTINQVAGATTGTINLSANQTLSYENRICSHALFLNGVIYGVGTLEFSRVTDEVENTTEPLTLSAGTAQTILLSPVGAGSSSGSPFRAKPFDFRAAPINNGTILEHRFDCDNLGYYAFNADGSPNLSVSVSSFYDVNNALDRDRCWLNAPAGSFSGILYVFPFYLNA